MPGFVKDDQDFSCEFPWGAQTLALLPHTPSEGKDRLTIISSDDMQVRAWHSEPVRFHHVSVRLVEGYVA
jgi:hypothetical protein